MDKLIKYLGIGLSTVGVLAVAAVAAYAATGGFRSQDNNETGSTIPAPIVAPGGGYAAPGQGGPSGEVAAIGTDHLILLALNGSRVRVNLSSQTLIHLAESRQPGGLSDINVGDQVRVNGHPNVDGSFEAQMIWVLPDGADLRGPPPGSPGQGKPGLPGAPGPQVELGGKVLALNNTSLTLLSNNGQEWEVRILELTSVRLIEGDRMGDLGDIQTGDQVRVHGLPKDPDAFEARLILVLPHGDHMAGRVDAVDGAIIALTTPQGKLNVVVSPATRFQTAPDQDDTFGFPSIKEGMHLIAYGELQADGSLIARLVILRQQGGSGGPGKEPQPPGLYPGPPP